MTTSHDENNDSLVYANRHIPKFLSLPYEKSAIQVVDDGSQLTAEALLDSSNELTLQTPILVTDSPESIGMKVLKSKKQKEISVGKIADVIGAGHPIHVIDVEHQEELEGWTLGDLVDYLEDEDRLAYYANQKREQLESQCPGRPRRARKSADSTSGNPPQRPRVLNQISLEFSKTRLARYVTSPTMVRDLDWITQAWPERLREEEGVYPRVQYYCLTSTRGCYTDFHIDFGGTAVWYHVLTGSKEFCLIPPTAEYLKIYEDWLCSPQQADTFLADLIPNSMDVLRIHLKTHQTLIIPTGWIHAVYTPDDSVVLGGNFLHGIDMDKQLDVHCIETRTRVPERFRFPYFLPLQFYAGAMYLGRLQRGDPVSQREKEGLPKLMHALSEWWKVNSKMTLAPPSAVSAMEEICQQYNCTDADDFFRKMQYALDNYQAPPPKTTPPMRLRLHMDPQKIKADNIQQDEGFNIVVQPESLGLHSSSSFPSRIRTREDKDWIAGDRQDQDDDWEPSRRGKRKITSPLTKSKLRSSARPKSPARTMLKRPKQQKTTSRQRLMKRFR